MDASPLGCKVIHLDLVKAKLPFKSNSFSPKVAPKYESYFDITVLILLNTSARDSCLPKYLMVRIVGIFNQIFCVTFSK